MTIVRQNCGYCLSTITRIDLEQQKSQNFKFLSSNLLMNLSELAPSIVQTLSSRSSRTPMNLQELTSWPRPYTNDSGTCAKKNWEALSRMVSRIDFIFDPSELHKFWELLPLYFVGPKSVPLFQLGHTYAHLLLTWQLAV